MVTHGEGGGGGTREGAQCRLAVPWHAVVPELDVDQQAPRGLVRAQGAGLTPHYGSSRCGNGLDNLNAEQTPR